jgi:RNA polymerase sigma-54 factor
MLAITQIPRLTAEHRVDHRLIVQMYLLMRSNIEIRTDIEAAITDNEMIEKESDEFDFPALQAFLRNSSTAPAGGECRDDDFSREDLLTRPVNLREHLERQIGEMKITRCTREACLLIIDNLNKDGYLPEPALQELAEENGYSIDEIQSAVAVVQSLEPAGVAARDLRECLMLQLADRGDEKSVAYRILNDFFDRLVKGDSAGMARALNVSRETVLDAQARIRRLDPHPGLKFSGLVVESAVPEVRIELKSGEYVVTPIEDRFPRLRMNPSYVRMLDDPKLDSQTRKYLAERAAAASQFLGNLQWRKRTIVEVCEAIVRRQRAFFDHGPDHLLPMLMIDVASDVGRHPATVSRAVANKFAETPRGPIALRSLFSPTVSSASPNVSIETVKAKIRKIIASEDPKRPLTDDRIAERLASEGVRIARRSVSGYREELHLPNARRRTAY